MNEGEVINFRLALEAEARLDGADILPFKGKTAEPEASPFTADERVAITGALQNLLAVQGEQEKQIGTLIAIISEQASFIRDLQHDVARLKKAEAKKPVILNAQGARAN